jgi:integrase
MATIRKRLIKNGYLYDVDFYVNGKRYLLSTRTSNRKIALKILGDIQSKIALGNFNLADYNKKDTTLKKFFNEYFPYALSFKRESTIVNELNVAKTFIEFAGENRNLRSIDIHLLDKWKTKLLNRVSPTTYNIHRRFLHAALNVAVKWGYIEKNPVSVLSKLKIEERRNFFTEEEIQKIFVLMDSDIADPNKKHLLKMNTLFRLYVEFLLNTGLRRNEALNLKIEHVDFGKNLIYIERTKGKKYRPIPLNRRARHVLLELGENLFTKLKPESVSHKFGDMMEHLNLKGFKLHSLRHTFATRLVSAGVDIYAVKELLGHQDIRTSMVYAKADTETLQRAVDALKN